MAGEGRDEEAANLAAWEGVGGLAGTMNVSGGEKEVCSFIHRPDETICGSLHAMRDFVSGTGYF